MTYKYVLIRREIYENKPDAIFRGKRSVRDIIKLYRFPYLVFYTVYFLALIMYAIFGLLFSNEKNAIYSTVIAIILIVPALLLDLPRERTRYKMTERKKEIEKQKVNYNAFIQNTYNILCSYEIDTKIKIRIIKSECISRLQSSSNIGVSENNKVIEVLIIYPISSIISSLIEKNDLVHYDMAITTILIGILFYAFIRLKHIVSYLIDSIYKDRYLLDVLEELEYYDDEELKQFLVNKNTLSQNQR